MAFKLKLIEESTADPRIVTELYTDGGLIDRNPSKLGGTWAFVAVNGNGAPLYTGYGYVPSPEGREITNNHMEQIAIIKALESVPDGWSGKVCSDSQIALGRVFMGWATRNLPGNIITRTEAALARVGRITWELIQGHPTKADLACGRGKKRGYRVSDHNVQADELCKVAANDYLREHGLPERK